MTYDAVICVAQHHTNIAVKAMRSLVLFSSPTQIFVITSASNFAPFEKELQRGLPLVLIDEDSLIKGVTLRVIKEYLEKRGADSSRGGWYLQQFLKMAVCRLQDIAEFYLIWDSDTVMLQSMQFFDNEGRILVNPLFGHHHKPYFDLTRELLGISRCVNFSFISEHLMVRKSWMSQLVGRIEEHCAERESWVYAVLDRIDDEHLGGAGFSEYETYGSYVHTNYPDAYRCQPIESLRTGAAHFGSAPNRYSLYLLSKQYSYVSFETWNAGSCRKTSMHKIAALFVYYRDYIVSRLSGHTYPSLYKAAELCR